MCGQTRLKITAHNRCSSRAKLTNTLAPCEGAPPHKPITLQSVVRPAHFCASRALSTQRETGCNPKRTWSALQSSTVSPGNSAARAVTVAASFFELGLFCDRGTLLMRGASRLKGKTERTQHAPGARFVQATTRSLFYPVGDLLCCPQPAVRCGQIQSGIKFQRQFCPYPPRWSAGCPPLVAPISNRLRPALVISLR